MRGYGVDRSGSGYGQMAGICECDNEPLGSKKCGELDVDNLRLLCVLVTLEIRLNH